MPNETPEPPEPTSATTQEEIVQEQAAKDLQDILFLKGNKPFNRYFMRKIETRILKISEELLENDNLSETESARKRTERKTLLSIRSMLTEDEAGNRSITGFVKQNPLPATQ